MINILNATEQLIHKSHLGGKPGIKGNQTK